MQKLDYLQDLGVTCLWLLPFFPSPLRDDGYDISDYLNVNPSYGTLDDFKAFLAAAHERNIQVMMELVVNHTSDQHPWFQRARRAPTDRRSATSMSGATPTRNTRMPESSLPIPKNPTGPGIRSPKQYFWHRFFSHQPDLNYDNPQVHRRSSEHHAVLAGYGRGWSAHRRNSVSGGARRHQLREPARDSRGDEEDSRRDR